MIPLDIDNFPEKQKHYARAALADAARKGVVAKPDTCERCGKTFELRRIIGHHHKGYADEHVLDVQWLCIGCHTVVHYHARLTRSEIAAEARRATTHEQRVEWGRRAGHASAAKYTFEELSQRGREIQRQLAARLTPAEYSEIKSRGGKATAAKTRKPRTPCVVCNELAKPGAKTCGQDMCVRTMKSRAGQAGNKTRWGSRKQ